MINTSAPLFVNDRFEITMKRQQAELYTRMYALMAEDFVTNIDVQNYVKLLTQCVTAMQEQLDTLFMIISNHTHNVPPHTHALTPHTHISNAPGSISSPNIAGLNTLPTPLTSSVPTESGSIKWNTITSPEIINTTGVIHNLEGSKVIMGPSLEGPLVTTKRRMKTPEVLNTTKSIPPILEGVAGL